jgi:hypothetical protein
MEMFRLLHERFPVCSLSTKGLLLSAYLKIFLMAPQDEALKAEVLGVYTRCAAVVYCPVLISCPVFIWWYAVLRSDVLGVCAPGGGLRHPLCDVLLYNGFVLDGTGAEERSAEGRAAWLPQALLT